MEMKLRVRDVALSLGILFAIIHAAFITLVVSTNGSIVAWGMSEHFFTIPGINATPFDAVTAVYGIVEAFVGGAVIGAVFAVIWNRVSK